MNVTCRNASDVVVLCENVLGWTPSDHRPIWQSRAIEAGKINAAIKKDPKTVTFENLELAVEYSRRKKLPVKSPVGLVKRIDSALAEAPTPENKGDVQQAVDDAITHELSTQKFGHDAWVRRLSQAYGPGRRKVLDDWKAAGRDR